jgi:hypothetical protein
METHRAIRHRSFHIFLTVDSQIAMRLLALRAGRSLPPGRFLVLIFVSLSRPHGQNLKHKRAPSPDHTGT